MSMFAHARTRKPGHEGGFTLPELAVATMVMLIIGAAVLTFIVISARQYTGQEDRVTTTDDARNALLLITNELRDAGAVTFVDSQTVQAEVRATDGTFHQVTFACEGSSCSRTDATTEEESVLVEGVENEEAFALIAGSDVADATSEGGAVQVRLELPVDEADNPIVLSSAVRPRNCSATAGVINPC